MTEETLSPAPEKPEDPSWEEEEEDLPRGPVHHIGEEALLTLFGLLKNLKIHEKDNAILAQLNEELLAISSKFRDAVGENLQIQIFADEFFADEMRLVSSLLNFSGFLSIKIRWALSLHQLFG